MSVVMPSLFVSHGAPTLAIEPGPTHDFLRQLGTQLGRPRAILSISAHWTTPQPLVSSGAHPEMIYDFYGFPEPLYQLDYPAPGSPELANRVATLLSAADIPCDSDPNRGFDHGTWVPLILAYPAGGIPLVQLSVQPHLSAAHHFALGEALQPLRKDGVLIVASGSATHNLRDYFTRPVEAPQENYAVAFVEWLKETVAIGDTTRLIDWLRAAPHVQRCHPTPEHFLPLLVSLGAGGGGPGRTLHDAMERGVLAMSSFAWG